MESGLLKVQRQAKKTHDSVSLGFQRLSEHSLKYQRETEAQTAALKRQEVQARQTAAAAAKIGSNTLLSPAFQGLGNGGGTFARQQAEQVQRASLATQIYARTGVDNARRFGELRRYAELRKSVIATRKAVIQLGRDGLPVLGDLATGAAGLALAFDENLNPLSRLTAGIAGLTNVASGLKGGFSLLSSIGVGGAAVGTAGTVALPIIAAASYDIYKSNQKITEEKQKQADIDRKLLPIQQHIYAMEARREALAVSRVSLAKRMLEINQKIAQRRAARAGQESDVGLEQAMRREGADRLRRLTIESQVNQKEIVEIEQRIERMRQQEFNNRKKPLSLSLAERRFPKMSRIQSRSFLDNRDSYLIEREKNSVANAQKQLVNLQGILSLQEAELRVQQQINIELSRKEDKQRDALRGLRDIARQEAELLSKEKSRDYERRVNDTDGDGYTSILSRRSSDRRRQLAEVIGLPVEKVDTTPEVDAINAKREQAILKAREERNSLLDDLGRAKRAFDQEMEGVTDTMDKAAARLAATTERIEEQSRLTEEKNREANSRARATDSQSRGPKRGNGGRY